ncbi:MAG: hypothetical protein MRJ65_16275 [Candidatus Brocadiaceae bacterium]|nr:hypothetical protein [Candidatus Brocadiaceae bacterium]
MWYCICGFLRQFEKIYDKGSHKMVTSDRETLFMQSIRYDKNVIIWINIQDIVVILDVSTKEYDQVTDWECILSTGMRRKES